MINWKGLKKKRFHWCVYILSACWPEVIDEKSQDERCHV